MMFGFLNKKKTESEEKIEEPKQLNFDEVELQVRNLSPRAQATLMYRIVGALHPNVLNTVRDYITNKQLSDAKNRRR